MRKPRTIIAAVTAIAVMAIPAVASANPYPTAEAGCFGQGRAWAVTQDWDAAAPGHSEMGKAASARAGDNAAINAAWKAANCS